MSESTKRNTVEGLIRPMKRKNDPPAGADVLLALIPQNLEHLLNHVQSENPTSCDLGFFRMCPVKEGSYAFRKGTVWTTDAPYRETPDKVKAYKDKGVLAVEMEMSALMTVAVFRSVRLTGLLVVSDELFHLKWHTGFNDPKFKDTSRRAAELLLGVISSSHG
jgi:nucleoside phosphorylase